MTVGQMFKERVFTALKKEAIGKKCFDVACETLAGYLNADVARKLLMEAYDTEVSMGNILLIELISLQEKNDLKEMARKYADKKTGMDYCKILHLFLCWMNEEKQD